MEAKHCNEDEDEDDEAVMRDDQSVRSDEERLVVVKVDDLNADNEVGIFACAIVFIRE